MAFWLNNTISLPMKLDAFIFNGAVCEGEGDDKDKRAKIASITQPNYASLRLHDALIQGDVLPPVDIHSSFSKETNWRYTDVDGARVHKNRLGVYLHWMLPRLYRAGVAAAGGTDGMLDRNKEGLSEPHGGNAETDDAAPQFRPVPTRWLVIRRLRDCYPPIWETDLSEYQSWVVESDKRTDVADVGKDVDIQVEMAPFVDATDDGNPVSIDRQAQVLIGAKTRASEWQESGEARPPMTVLHGGNMLFPDFQQHNSNVFSILDNFDYKDYQQKPKKLETATADYYVIGWHADTEQDPFFIEPSSGVTREERLKRVIASLSPDSRDGDTWAFSDESGISISHGAMYGVEWDVNKLPKNIPGDKVSQRLQDENPVAVGSTPLDALLGYVRASQTDEDDKEVKKVMEAIVNLQSYLLVDDDTVDGHERAADLLYNFNFDNHPGGFRWHVASATDPDKPTVRPDDALVAKLERLNREQVRLDALYRTQERLRWRIFAIWWKYVSRELEPGDVRGVASPPDTKAAVEAWKGERQKLEAAWTVCAGEIDKIINQDAQMKDLIAKNIVSKSVHPNFHTQNDPTLLVGHIQSAWPHDWLEPLLVRVNTDITTWDDRDGHGEVLRAIGIDKLPSTIQDTAGALINEFIALTDDKVKTVSNSKTILPLYHDIDIRTNAQRDHWNGTQPFFPLFLEWETEYAHIDFAQWSFKERALTKQGAQQLSYGIESVDPPLYDRPEWKMPKDQQDIRVVSGRTLILPQAALSLQTQINAIIDQTPRDELEDALDGVISVDDLRRDLGKLAFLSSPLAGFHNHLSTVSPGTHITPTIRQPGAKLRAIAEASDPDAGIDDEIVDYMGTQTNVTPYASLVQVSDKVKESPFKPAAHGQFKFTKLNIVDKFGQVAHALDPRWTVNPGWVQPCLSDLFAPDGLLDGSPNTVEKAVGVRQPSHYAQVPPHINQMARLNSAFVRRSDQWVSQGEWDNPIWGWIVFNYMDKAIQFFLQDGTFYREVRLGGEKGTSETWLPFKKTDKTPADKTQLDHLVDKVAGSQAYLEAFMAMVSGAMDYAAAAPDSYGQFLNSVVGRPLALVNMAWSLELGTGEWTNQSDVLPLDPRWSLLPETKKSGHEGDPVYTFPVKLGDEKRAYDGLVGYFQTLPESSQTNDSYLDLDTCYTFYGLDQVKGGVSPLAKIGQGTYPRLSPFHLDPVANSAADMQTQRNRMLARSTFGAILDPFRPVHGFTGILPIQPLSVPEWTWQQAMAKMTAFFHVGPLTVVRDVPAFDEKLVLTTHTDLADDTQVIADGAALPRLGNGDWAWLQPYSEADATSFMPLGLAGADTRPTLQVGPYTAIEGYLQLRRPIVRD